MSGAQNRFRNIDIHKGNQGKRTIRRSAIGAGDERFPPTKDALDQ